MQTTAKGARGIGVSILLAASVTPACHEQSASSKSAAAGSSEAIPQSNLRLSSSAFAAEGAIPSKYTCEGQNVSPPLAWTGAPAGTKSFALVVRDPDAPDPAAPKLVVTHWIVYDLPSDVLSLAEGDVPSAAFQGKNQQGDTRYMGPCPPIGRHRYYFQLYALDLVLPDLVGPTKPVLESAMKGHILGSTELMGTYQKQGT